MVDWYWALEGWQWIVATVVLLSSVVVAWLGAVVLMAKTIAKGGEQHKINTCPCNACQIRRAKAWNKRTDGGKRLIRKNHPGALVSTMELNPGDIVTSRKGPRYHVDDVIPREYAIVVKLTSMSNERKSWVTVKNERKHIKTWLIDGNPPERLIGL